MKMHCRNGTMYFNTPTHPKVTAYYVAFGILEVMSLMDITAIVICFDTNEYEGKLGNLMDNKGM